MGARSCARFLAVVGVLLVASGEGRSRLSIDAASPIRYEEVRDWPTLPAGVQLGEVPGVDVDANGHVFVFHRPGRGFEPDATEPLTAPAVLEIDADTGKLIASWGANTFLVPHGITVDGANNIWLTDVGLQQVQCTVATACPLGRGCTRKRATSTIR